jgi:hypothetical protein
MIQMEFEFAVSPCCSLSPDVGFVTNYPDLGNIYICMLIREGVVASDSCL